MKDSVEALLFAAGRFVDEDFAAKTLQADVRKVRKALDELREDYNSREGCALRVVQEDKQWKLTVRDEYLGIASKLVSDKEIATTVLETLAVVAWKNPIMQSELIKIRGPAAYEHIAELVERSFITKVPSGRTFKLTLQEKFFDYFDVEGREDLKKLFAPVDQHTKSEQADIASKQAIYDAAAEVAQEASENPNLRFPELENAEKHSAQNFEQPDILKEIRAAAEQLARTSIPEMEEEQEEVQEPRGPPPEAELGREEQRVAGNLQTEKAVADVEQAVKAFGEEIKELKEELSHDAEEGLKESHKARKKKK